MLRNFKNTYKDGFYIWFDKKYKKEYYITQVEMCKTKFVKEQNSKFNSIKLISGYTNTFESKENVYYSTSDILSPFEENYGMFLINFLNANFSTFESAYLTFFCFYGMKLLEEFYNNMPNACSFESEIDFKEFYEKIFYTVKVQIKNLQNNIRLCVNYSYNLKGITEYKNLPYLTKFISYSIKKNLFKYTTNINVYFNVNYAYNINEISPIHTTPAVIKRNIENRIINPTESNIFYSKYISNLVYLCLTEIATNTNVSIGICKNCGKYFISYKKKPDTYCRITYAENEEICKDVGIQIAYKNKQKDNPCLTLYRKTYQKKLMYAKRSGNETVKQAFTEWKALSRQKVKDFNNGAITENELTEWLNANK